MQVFCFSFSEIKETFLMFDKNGEGVITTDVFGDCIRALGQSPSNADVDELLTTITLNG